MAFWPGIFLNCLIFIAKRPSSKISNFDLHRNKAKLGRFSLALFTSTSGPKISKHFQVAQEPEWANTTDSDLLEIQNAVHRQLLSRQSIYHMVLYPNREIDIQRDAVFSEHIASIAMKITPGHPKLQIPSKYCRECPWPSAQEEARLIAVYRTPQEKMTQTARLCKVNDF